MNDIIKDYQEGMQIEQILLKYNLCTEKLYKILHETGVPINRIKMTKSSMKTFHVLRELFNPNLTFRDIAKVFDVSYQRVGYVYQCAREAQIPGLPERH